MKIVAVDNFARESVADFLIAERIADKARAETMCKELNDRYCNGDFSSDYYVVMEDDARLSRGMEDLV